MTCAYGNDYRLIRQEMAGAWATFGYDPAGNIELKHQQGTAPMSFTFDAANRIINYWQGAVLTTVTFDNNGNQTVENAMGSRTTNVFDPENRFVQVLNPDGTRSTYSYAGTGLRRTAQEPGETVKTVLWNGDDYLMEKN